MGRKSYSEVEDSSEFGTSRRNHMNRFKAYPSIVSYENYAHTGPNENNASPEYLSNSMKNMYWDKIIKYKSRKPFVTSNRTPEYSDQINFAVIDSPIMCEMMNLHIDDRNSIMTPDTFTEISNYNNKQKNNRVVETDRTDKISRKKYKCQHSNKKYLETLPCLGYLDLPKVNSETSTNIGQPYRNRNHQELCDDTHSRLPHRVDSLLTSTNPVTSWDPPKKDEYERISKSISLKSIYDFLKQGIRVYNSVMDYIKRGWPFVYRWVLKRNR